LAALAAAIAPVLTLGASGVSAAGSQATWEQWLHLPGVFDVAGPRRDGQLVAAVHSGLVLVSPSGTTRAFAPAYSAPDGSESYIALSPGIAVDGAGCRFARDEVLALDLRGTPPGVARIGADGTVTHLADVPGASTLTGIALDTVGGFGHRLVVTGPATQPGRTEVAAVDCRGGVRQIGLVDTPLEGGMALAPRDFGPYGGQLIAPDEGGGSIYAVSPTGRLSTVAASGVPAGGDIGVESAGFVPASGATAAYMADRGTPGNPHPGTDSVLRLRGTALTAAGVGPGDLLVGTEGGATVVRVRCAPGCAAAVVATGPPAAHGEGRLLAVARARGRGSAGPGAVVLSVAALAVAVGSFVAVARRRRGRAGGI
jgi:hypothetical protein